MSPENFCENVPGDICHGILDLVHRDMMSLGCHYVTGMSRPCHRVLDMVHRDIVSPGRPGLRDAPAVTSS